MKNKNCYFVIVLSCFFGLVIASFALANSGDLLQPAQGPVIYSQPVQINNTLSVEKNLKVGGVVFNKNKYEKPVLKVADTLIPGKDDKINLGSAKKYWKNAYIKNLYLGDLQGEVINTDNLVSGAVTGDKIAAGAVTQTGEAYGSTTQTTTAFDTNYDLITTKVDITTTGESTLLIMFSGVLNTNTNDGHARILLFVDGQAITHSTRRGTGGDTPNTFTLTTNALVKVSAGSHTVQVGWNTDYAVTAYLYNHTLDVIELKK